MSQMLDELKSMVADIEAALVAESISLALLLKAFPIYASSSVRTACTDGRRIYLNPQFFLSLPPKGRVHVLLHELFHILLMHIPRSQKFIEVHGLQVDPQTRLLLNIAADLIVESRLPDRFADKALLSQYPRDLLEKAASASFEEVAEEILRERGGDGSGCSTCALPSLPKKSNNEKNHDTGSGSQGGSSSSPGASSPPGDLVYEAPGDATLVREGDKEPESEKELEEKVKRKMLEAYITEKAMGSRIPGWLARLVDELVKPAVDWRAILKSELVRGLGRHVRRSWCRPSRKNPVMPGKELWSPARVAVLVDTSGSIGLSELRRFVSEIYGIAGEAAEVVVIPWDATAYEPIHLRRRSDIRRLELTGGGDTVILPALKVADKIDAEIMVIFSDWLISDLDSHETLSLLNKNAKKIIACTSHAEPPRLPFRRVIKVKT